MARLRAPSSRPPPLPARTVTAKPTQLDFVTGQRLFLRVGVDAAGGEERGERVGFRHAGVVQAPTVDDAGQHLERGRSWSGSLQVQTEQPFQASQRGGVDAGERQLVRGPGRGVNQGALDTGHVGRIGVGDPTGGRHRDGGDAQV